MELLLSPRYGGYSESGFEEVSSYGSFPYHGGYSLGNNDLVKKGMLFPRSGGYSITLILRQVILIVVSLL